METLDSSPGGRRFAALDSPAFEAAVARAGYFGRDEQAQRARRRLHGRARLKIPENQGP